MEIKRCYDTLIGASVAENQLFKASAITNSGMSFTRSEDRSIQYINGTSTSVVYCNLYSAAGVNQSIVGHVYYVNKDSDLQTFQIYNDSAGVDTGTNRSVIGKATAVKNFYIRVNADVTYDNLTIRPQFIDLTALLGSSIADYIYSIESATAGSGIAKLREWGFLRGYHAFNAGSIESVEVTGKKVVGFNQWDEEWELGTYINATGAKYPYATKIRNVNPIRVLPNTQYYYHVGSTSADEDRIWFYDADMTFISSVSFNHQTSINQQFTTPSNCSFINFSINNTTYNNDICINLSSSRNGEYEPYTEQTYDYGDDTLNGIFKLDANNKLYADGDRKESDGTVTRKYGIVDLGTLTWTKEIDGLFTTKGLVGQVKEPATYNANPNLVCSKYLSASYAELWSNAKDKTVTVIWSESGSHGQVWVRDSAYADASAFATAMSGVMLVYPLATETTEQGDPFPSPQVCYPDGTEEYVTETSVPVGHETKYQL